MGINMKNIALRVAKIEGKKVQVNIAQIMEVGKCYMIELGKHKNKEIIATINRYRPKGKKIPYGK